MPLMVIKTKPVAKKERKVKKKKVIPVVWVKSQALAEHFDVSTTTIWRWRNRTNKPLPVHENDGVVRFDLVECDSWYKEKKL